MSDVKLTAKQQQAMTMIGSDATHVMLFGGARSGKTYINVRSIVVRAMRAPSRHAILRYHFKDVKATVGMDTFIKIMETNWPELHEQSKLQKQDWVYTMPNGSEIWFGGVDDKKQTEKILGFEFVTIFLNECSQITWAARETVRTRLAQKVELEDGRMMRPKFLYDCNPPSQAHWTYKLFIKKQKLTETGAKPVANPDNFVALQMNPVDNVENLTEDYIEEMKELTGRKRLQFLEGRFASISDTALWTPELIDANRVSEHPQLQRVVISIDPSGCEGEEDERSDEIGIIVAGLDFKGHAYILEDLSGRFGPNKWAKIACDAYKRWQADRIVAEVNFGGALVVQNIKTVNKYISVVEMRASRGKVAQSRSGL